MEKVKKNNSIRDALPGLIEEGSAVSADKERSRKEIEKLREVQDSYGKANKVLGDKVRELTHRKERIESGFIECVKRGRGN